MKFRYVNPHNVRHLVPSWAFDSIALSRDIENLLSQYFSGRKAPKWDSLLPFWIDYKSAGDGFFGRVAEPTSDFERSFCGTLTIEFESKVVIVPLNDILKGSNSLDGTHSVYFHAIETDVTLFYVGITKQRWFDRWAQHESSARCGSGLVFHRALREHESKRMFHRVFLTNLDHESAMNIEEEFVGLVGLYPKGLNMIPGGFAGIRYLGSLGVTVRNSQERDDALDNLVGQESLSGKPNPLCAARWAADQDYVNRVVCGHSGRLTVDQIRQIRMLAASGFDVASIAGQISDAPDRVRRVMSGAVYGRVS